MPCKLSHVVPPSSLLYLYSKISPLAPWQQEFPTDIWQLLILLITFFSFLCQANSVVCTCSTGPAHIFVSYLVQQGLLWVLDSLMFCQQEVWISMPLSFVWMWFWLYVSGIQHSFAFGGRMLGFGYVGYGRGSQYYRILNSFSLCWSSNFQLVSRHAMAEIPAVHGSRCSFSLERPELPGTAFSGQGKE